MEVGLFTSGIREAYIYCGARDSDTVLGVRVSKLYSVLLTRDSSILICLAQC